jgi:hypothetical protein
MFRFCLVGFGRWGRVYYNTINRLADCQLDCIVVNPNSKVAQPVLDVPVFFNLVEAINSRTIDGVIVATPPKLHLYFAKICLELGVPVLVEKPFGDGHEQAVQISEAARRSNTFCMAGYQHLFASGYLTLKSGLFSTSNDLVVYSEGVGNGPHRKEVPVFRDWGSHEFAMAIDLFDGLPTSVLVKRIGGLTGDEFNAIYSMQISFDRGRIFSSVFGNAADIKRRVLIAAHKDGWRFYNGLDRGGCVVMENGIIALPDLTFTAGALPVDLMLNAFMENAKKKSYVCRSLDVALKTSRLVDKFESFCK